MHVNARRSDWDGSNARGTVFELKLAPELPTQCCKFAKARGGRKDGLVEYCSIKDRLALLRASAVGCGVHERDCDAGYGAGQSE
jgi:hypothetical protein